MKESFDGTMGKIATQDLLSRFRAKRPHVMFLDVKESGDLSVIQSNRTQDRDLISQPCKESPPVVIASTR